MDRNEHKIKLWNCIAVSLSSGDVASNKFHWHYPMSVQ